MNKLVRNIIWAGVSLAITAFLTLAIIILYLEAHLPSIDVLNNVQMQIPLRVYTKDKQLIGVFGEKRRIPVSLNQIPLLLVKAVLATEDQRFFEHGGVDFIGLSRAFLVLLQTGTKSQGASTITMQVARNFFLTRKKTLVRKLNEILLAIKIDQTLSKDKILELYLNKIYFGNRAYGVAAAAEVYFGKTLNQLTLPEIALIAGLPKAPSSLNPIANPKAAKERRNHVLERMLKEKYIDEQTYQIAVNAPITASYHMPKLTIKAPYAAEMARQIMLERFGEDAYTKGYQVYTTIDPRLQNAADTALRNAILNYTKRHGFHRPQVNLKKLLRNDNIIEWVHYLRSLRIINGLHPAAITHLKDNSIAAILGNEEVIQLHPSGFKWLQNYPRDVLKVGDVIYVELSPHGEWELEQVPQVEGALVALSPQDGALKAITGGFDFARSSFNRVTQAERQAGSSFKPFIYSAALEKGYTLASIVNDAPIVISDPSQPDMVWRPQNDTKRFYGPTRLRVALAHSRNLVTIRLLQSIGLSYTVQYLKRFGFQETKLPKTLSLALGTASLTPMDLTTGYAVFANGGYKISPYIIEKIADADGNILLTANPKVACDDCHNKAPAVISPQNAYIMTSVLQEVIKSGTGHAATSLKRTDLAGKTGTSDDFKDAWFIGFNSDLVASSWIGYDQPRSTHEHGAQAALPMWIEFMGIALKNQPTHTLPRPEGIVTVKIDPETGASDESSEGAISEIMREEDVHNLPQSSGEEENEEDDGGESNVETDENLF